MHLHLLHDKLKWYSFHKSQTTKKVSPPKKTYPFFNSRTFPPVASTPLCQCKACSSNSCSGRMVQVTCISRFHPWDPLQMRDKTSLHAPKKKDHSTRSYKIHKQKRMNTCRSNGEYHEETENCTAYGHINRWPAISIYYIFEPLHTVCNSYMQSSSEKMVGDTYK